MKIIPAVKANEEKVAAFTEINQEIDKERLLSAGYVVEIQQEIQGCFVLSTMEEADEYWLQQLFITKQAMSNLPVLLEMIVVITKGKQAKKLYIHSHQPVVDLLLDALQFHEQQHHTLPNQARKQGKWWAYHVS
ncbi:hypothetical protein DX933_14290 [Ornithinibacillus gellani]|uniref:hypothetical protein n=1 Tax=Ornithinibacillus gellani TaxID=2293253 RepID=UPI000F467E41|nr:hypothetical protein [Ornithinibacillus gellani]TQS72149.1 hypothetical protein DX933_14290 [Ornithinibacillus gellani]